MADQRVRQLKIKTGVVKRIIKEKIGYEGEIEKKRTEVQKMIDQKKDSHDINKQKEVLAESEMMIPDCLKRLDKGILDLENFLKDIGTASPLEQTEEMKEARKALSDGKNMLQAAAAASGETLHK